MYGKAFQKPEKMLEIFERMEKDGMKPTAEVYEKMLDGLQKSQKKDSIAALKEKMTQQGISLDSLKEKRQEKEKKKKERLAKKREEKQAKSTSQ